MNSLLKHAAFFENARLLNVKFNIVPLMYGSLGLEFLTGRQLNADDIDILIPKQFVTSRFEELKAFLEQEGYTLIDEREHTFLKDGLCYSYAQIEELEAFAQIFPGEIETKEVNSVRFKLLSLEQYLKVYTASEKDGYRINTRGKKDAEKIAFIKNLLK